MIKQVLCLATFAFVAVSAAKKGPRCYDTCAAITEMTLNGDPTFPTSYLEGKKMDECSTETIKYCKPEETCNTITNTVHLATKVTSGSSFSHEGDKDGLTMTYHYCGGAADSSVTASTCKQIGDKIPKMFDDAGPFTSGTSSTSVKVTEVQRIKCGAVKTCDGKADPCVDMNKHPDYVEPKDENKQDPHDQVTPSAAETNKLGAFFLPAFLILAHLI